MPWADHAWTRADLPAGLAALARKAGIVSAQDALRMPANTEFDLTAAHSGNIDSDDHDFWLGKRADELGIRLEAVSARYPKLREMLLNAAPAVLRIDCDGREGFILLTGSRGETLRVLDTGLKERRISCTEVIEAMSPGWRRPYRRTSMPAYGRLASTQDAGLGPRRHPFRMPTGNPDRRLLAAPAAAETPVGRACCIVTASAEKRCSLPASISLKPDLPSRLGPLSVRLRFHPTLPTDGCCRWRLSWHQSYRCKWPIAGSPGWRRLPSAPA